MTGTPSRLPYSAYARARPSRKRTVRGDVEATSALRFLDDFDDAAVGIDGDPITRLDDLERILIEIGDARYPHDDGAERDLRRHLVEDERLGCGSGQSGRVIHRRPTGRAFRASEHQHLVLEADATKLVLRLGDDPLD